MGAPVATAGFGALNVVIPETIAFIEGTDYQLWLQGRDAKGQSNPDPITVWTS